MQKSFGPRQIYTALRRIKTYDKLYIIGKFKKSAIKVHKDALFKYECLKQNDLFSAKKEVIYQKIQLESFFIM